MSPDKQQPDKELDEEGQARDRERRASLEAEAVAKRKRGVEPEIADADKIARTGSRKERVRDTPPAGSWNDVSDD
jgi:hypothetical protein